jgi:hypothetical protein
MRPVAFSVFAGEFGAGKRTAAGACGERPVIAARPPAVGSLEMAKGDRRTSGDPLPDRSGSHGL